MSIALSYSIFNDVLFPRVATETRQAVFDLSLRRSMRFGIAQDQDLFQLPWVVFDLETTGLDHWHDRMIEIGAQRIRGFEVEAEFSTLIDPGVPLSEAIRKITGIDDSMLVGQPTAATVLPQFLKFIEGAVLVAHNAIFDIGFIRAECERQGIDLQWPVFCSLKMARDLLSFLERRDLGALAEHYGLTFEARHRSIGDVKVTTAVLQRMFEEEGRALKMWRNLAPYHIN